MKDSLEYFVKGDLDLLYTPDANTVFLDLGCRKGELFALKGEEKGSYFDISDKNLKVREDLGSHVNYAYMPFAFTLNRNDYSEAGIYLFEPNSEYSDDLRKLAKKVSRLCKFVCFVPLAAWTENCNKNFGISDGGWGSTLLMSKANTKFERYETVSCIDILDFINSIDYAKEIHIKMDIEGAEYDILPHILNNFPANIKSISAEFHRDFFPKRDVEFWYRYSHPIINLIKHDICFNWWPGEW
jgi:FkbM family methyltransferase